MSIAFFDVDDTLVRRQTLFDFTRYALPRLGRSDTELDDVLTEMRSLRKSGEPREATNKHFYRILKGIDVQDLSRLGQSWWDETCDDPHVYVPSVHATLRRHRLDGSTIVLLSGSFPACLEPIASKVGADALLCTALVEENGRFTGDVVTPMVGQAKVEAAMAFAASAETALSDCHAYGDHSSDSSLLRAVGHPVAVGDDPEMRQIAISHGWPRMAYSERSHHELAC